VSQSAGPSTATELASARARAAWDRGGSELAAGRVEAARLWLARACRLAPSDLTPMLSLAAATLASGRAREAVPLFRAVAERADAGAAWLGLASACLRAGDPDGAAAALRTALSRHVLAGLGDGALADRVAGAQGWCGLGPDGRLIGRAAGPVRCRLDGVAWRGGLGDLVPATGATLRVRAGGRELLGSPLDLAAPRRLEGVVRATAAGGLAGWAWHPGDPARAPRLTLVAGAFTRAIAPDDRTVAAPRPLAEPRGFHVPAADLAGLAEPIAVLGPDGRHLAGSPLSLGVPPPMPLSLAAAPARAPSRPGRPVAVVVPVHRGARETMACLRDVIRTAPDAALIVVDDASPEPALVAALDALAGSGAARLLRSSRNLGFPGAANLGVRAALALDPPRDVVLLNSDTRLPPGWLDRLRAAVHAHPDIGTATPLSNDGSLASYPDPAGGNPAPTGRDLSRLARLAARANPGVVVEVPTGVGFCLYLRRECLAATGLLREDVFAQGYGEENDFCLRATRLGWRHVVVPGAYVAHVGGRSFGTARAALLERNLEVLERLHPGYRERIAAWHAADPLGPARRRLDRERWDARAAPGAGAVVLVTHAEGGGVERCVTDRAAALLRLGHEPILLRPARDRPGVARVDAAGFPNLLFRLPDERAALAAVLRPRRPAWLEVHHLLGHDPSIRALAADLAIPTEYRLHDYAAFCPRLTLTAADGRYCGEPAVSGCVACVAAHGGRLREAIDPAALRARSAADLAAARRVVVPSADMAARIGRHFPGLSVTVAPHEPDPVARAGAGAGASAAAGPGERRVLVVGGIGRAKGFDVLLACARDAAARRLDLRFAVVGHTLDDEALFETGRVDITGPYREGEAAALIAEQGACVGFLPSLWPETWCFALSEMLAAGLPVLAFDIGAQADRIRVAGQGWLLPLGAPAATINGILHSLRPDVTKRLAVRPNVMQTASIPAVRPPPGPTPPAATTPTHNPR
jgi:GT2 family glycosyltransferase/glycosyltransferase involved in cell wall biosynthesis